MMPILFSIGPLHLYSLSLFVVLAWSVWSLIFWKALRKEAIPDETIFDLMFWTTIGSFIGARIGFILMHQELFTGSILAMFALWVVPGLAFYPGIVVGVLTLVWLGRRRGIRTGLVLDALAISLPGTIAIGSIGSLFGGSLVGLAVKLPWAVPVVGFIGNRHPVGAYLAITMLLVLSIVSFGEMYAKKKDWPLGLLGVWFFLMFSVSGFLLEFVIEHALYWGLSANQWMLLLIFCQTIGAFYVRGGGRNVIRPIIRKGVDTLLSFPKILYGRIRPRAS